MRSETSKGPPSKSDPSGDSSSKYGQFRAGNSKHAYSFSRCALQVSHTIVSEEKSENISPADSYRRTGSRHSTSRSNECIGQRIQNTYHQDDNGSHGSVSPSTIPTGQKLEGRFFRARERGKPSAQEEDGAHDYHANGKYCKRTGRTAVCRYHKRYDRSNVDYSLPLRRLSTHEDQSHESSRRGSNVNLCRYERGKRRYKRKEGPFEGIHFSDSLGSNSSADYCDGSSSSTESRQSRPRGPISQCPTYPSTLAELDLQSAEKIASTLGHPIHPTRRITSSSKARDLQTQDCDLDASRSDNEGKVTRRISGRPMVGREAPKATTEELPRAIGDDWSDFPFSKATDLSGVVTAKGGIQVTGYTFTLTPRPLERTQLIHACECLDHTIGTTDIKEENPTQIVAGDISIVPGPSSATPAVKVQINGKWVVLQNAVACTSPLAEMEIATLNAQRLCEAAKDVDTGLASMVTFFLLGVGTYDLKIDHLSERPAISRVFSQKDVKMLFDKDIIRRGNADYSLMGFKVPKKEPNASRFITDCRMVNERCNIFEEEKMRLPSFHQLTDWALTYEHMWSIDANAYFYHFKLKGLAANWFPMRLATTRGPNFTSVLLSRMPMGFKLAPIIAQRTSNLIVHRVQQVVEIQGWNSKVAAWVDNFIVFANDTNTLEKVMKELQKQLSIFNIKCKDVDKSGELLGLLKTGHTLGLKSTWIEAFQEEVTLAQNCPTLPKKHIERLAGKMIWINYAVARKPLALFPHTLRLLRRLPLLQEENISLSKEEKQEIGSWTELAHHKLTYVKPIDPTVVWSDARPGILAVVYREFVFIALLPDSINIAVAETIAALWGFKLAKEGSRLMIDNTVAAFSIAKGHSTSNTINSLISNVFKGPTIGAVFWVPSQEQVADGPTRGALPRINTKTEIGKLIASNYLRFSSI